MFHYALHSIEKSSYKISNERISKNAKTTARGCIRRTSRDKDGEEYDNTERREKEKYTDKQTGGKCGETGRKEEE